MWCTAPSGAGVADTAARKLRLVDSFSFRLHRVGFIANSTVFKASPSPFPRTPELTALSATPSSISLPQPRLSVPSPSSQARRFSSVRSRFSLPELPLLRVRSPRVLPPTVRVLRVPAVRPPVAVAVEDVAEVAVLAAPVDLYVCSMGIERFAVFPPI